ncbi:MAG: DUF3854 domain-containing protein [Chloroflexota bacterium]|nr:DUF3854 domain-containing protein [Chloroflexota bacterium]
MGRTATLDASTPTLLPQHAALIKASGIAAAVAEARGYRSVTTKAEAGRLGFADYQRNVPALLVPIRGVTGEIATYQLRSDSPRIRDGKPLKYETPANSRMVIDVPPGALNELGDPARPLLVTEGARKADAAVSAGVCCIALLGVWNWRGRNEQGGVTALADWDSVAVKGRTVCLAFDSDAMTKHAVHAAATRLWDFLAHRGASMRMIYLPHGPGGKKWGLDDYLADGHSAADLFALASDVLRPMPGDDAVSGTEESGPYVVAGNRTYYRRGRAGDESRTELANFAARITEEVVGDDGAEERGELVVVGTLHDGTSLPPARVSLSRFETLDWVAKHWSIRAIVSAGQGNRDRMREAIQRLSPEPERRIEYRHPGWRQVAGEWLYLTAEAVIGSTGPVEGIAVHLEGTAGTLRLPRPPEGTVLAQAVRLTLTALDVAPDRITVPVLASPFRAVLNEADYADLVVFVVGPTGALKSELSALAQRAFGAGFERTLLPASWASTPNALERAAFDFKDALCVVDDFAPAGSAVDVRRYHATAERVIRGAGNAAGRSRMNADGTLRPNYPPRALIMGTGEDVPTGQSIRARMVVVEVERGDVNSAGLAAFQAGPGRIALSLAMAGYVQWLAGQYGSLAAKLGEERAELRAVLTNGGAHARTPEALANLALGWRYWLRFAVAAGGISVEESEAMWERVLAALRALGANQAAHQAEENPVHRFLELLTASLASQAAHVAGLDGGVPDNPLAWGWREATGGVGGAGRYQREEYRPSGPCVGWVDEDGLFLQPDAAYKAAQGIGSINGTPLALTPRTLWKRLHQAGLLARTESASERGTTVRKTVAGERRAVLHLSAGALIPTEPDQSAHSGQTSANNAVPGVWAFTDRRFARSDAATDADETDHENRPSATLADTEGRIGRNGRFTTVGRGLLP